MFWPIFIIMNWRGADGRDLFLMSLLGTPLDEFAHLLPFVSPLSFERACFGSPARFTAPTSVQHGG